MRLVLYTHHALFEPALSLVEALTDVAEVHLLLEVPSGDWRIASFEAPPQRLPAGLVDADPVLSPFYPAAVRDTWCRAASFHLVSHGPRRSRDPRSMKVTLRVLRWIESLRPDVLHVDDVDVSPRLALGLRLRRVRVPVVLGCHDPEPHTGERRWGMKRLTRMLAFPRCSAVVVHHAAGRDAVLRRHPRLRRPVHVVHLGAYTFMRHLQHDKGGDPGGQETDVLLFGRMTPYKGVEALFRAAPLVAERVPDVRFLVAGKPVAGYRPPPVPTLPHGGRIDTHLAYVPNTRIADLFTHARVAVCPYTDASQSGVVLTAYAFGCPVVVTSVGGLPDYVLEGSTGLVVPPGDHRALADALVRVLRDPELQTRLREGVTAAVETELSWQRAGSQLQQVYASVAERQRVVRRARG